MRPVIEASNVDFSYRVLTNHQSSLKTLFKDFINRKVRVENYQALKNVSFDVTKGAKLDGFGDISIAAPKECANLDPARNPLEEGKGHKLDKDSNLVRQLRDASQELLAYHVNKTVVLTDFLKELFTIKQRPNGTWEVKGINIKYLVLGFKGLDILTDQAREILVDYYEGCETIFQKKGLSKFKEVFKGEVADAESAAPAVPMAPAAVPTAPAAVPMAPAAPPAPAPRPPV